VLPLGEVLGGLMSVLLMIGTATAQDYTFTNIADTSGPFTAFGGASINSTGLVVFSGTLDTGPNGIFVRNPSSYSIVADSNGTLATFGNPVMNDTGKVAFYATLDGGGVGIFSGNAAGGSVPTMLAATGTPSPLGGLFVGFGEFTSINSSGTVAFTAGTSTRTGVFVHDGNIDTIIDDGGTLNGFGTQAAVNDSGAVAFAAFYDAQPSVKGIFRASASGSITTITDSNGPLTSNLVPGSLSDTGTVTLYGARNSGGDGIYKGNGGPLQTVLESSNAFGSFANQPSINDNDIVAYVTTAFGANGIFVGPSLADKVIQDGDSLFGAVVQGGTFTPGLSITSYAQNDDGQIAFTYTLSDGRRGIGLATPVPEPSAAALFLAGLCGGAMRHRTRR
jgi:hypothetical protein